MGRRRVLALGPALTRMQCMGNPYERIKGQEPGEGRSFWFWRRKSKSVKLGGKSKIPGSSRRRWGFRVARLRIRLVSPLVLLKKLRDAYVNMMLAIEGNAGDCSAMIMGPYPMQPAYPPYRGVPWVWPALPPIM